MKKLMKKIWSNFIPNNTFHLIYQLKFTITPKKWAVKHGTFVPRAERDT